MPPPSCQIAALSNPFAQSPPLKRRADLGRSSSGSEWLQLGIQASALTSVNSFFNFSQLSPPLALR